MSANYAEELGGRISQLIRRAGTLEDAARIAGVSTSTLRRWIRGTSSADFVPLWRLASAAGYSMDWLASGEGHGPVDSATELDTEASSPDPIAPIPLPSQPREAPGARAKLTLVLKDIPVDTIVRLCAEIGAATVAAAAKDAGQ